MRFLGLLSSPGHTPMREWYRYDNEVYTVRSTVCFILKKKFIFTVKMYILRLNIYILTVKMYIFTVKINFLLRPKQTWYVRETIRQV